jgi:transposase-like protein
MKKEIPKIIEMNESDYNDLMARVSVSSLSEEDKRVLREIVEGASWLSRAYHESKVNIGKIMRRIFGPKTEKFENIKRAPAELNKASDGTADAFSSAAAPQGHPRGNNNGRNGIVDYSGAASFDIRHMELSVGDKCPECNKKHKLYKVNPGSFIHVKGCAPILATVYKLESFRCSGCGKTFTASAPEDTKNQKYDMTALAVVSILKYGMGMPFNRLASFQLNLGMPFPESTQWDLVEKAGNMMLVIYRILVLLVANGTVIHNDDTTIKVLEYMQENKTKESGERKGMFTTGLVSMFESMQISIFISGRKHAGENLNEILKYRALDLGPPIQMCDALSRNTPEDFETILGNCNSHGRREFVDIESYYPPECNFVLETYKEVYKNDDHCKNNNLDPQQRLEYHKEKSGPLMDTMYKWFDSQFQERKVEPNCALGKAIKYMQNHWTELTRFLSVPGCPLDNNIVEQSLKKAILNRKNSYFFKTETGAKIADVHLSVIQTCNVNRINVFSYYVAILNNHEKVLLDPYKWLPWNYMEALKKME